SGSCVVLGNGAHTDTCAAPIPETAENVVIEPLHNFPVQKDLVVDIGDVMEKLGRVEPWIIRERERALEEGEYLQKPEQLEKYEQFSARINCMLCYVACPVIAADKVFIGPVAAALVYS